MEHYTSIKQSKNLLELGLNPETADMLFRPTINDTFKSEYTIILQRKFAVESNYICNIALTEIPCWSVGALLSLMPQSFEFHTRIYSFNFTITDNGYYQISYISKHRDYDRVESCRKSIIEAACDMISWLLEHKLVTEATKNNNPYNE